MSDKIKWGLAYQAIAMSESAPIKCSKEYRDGWFNCTMQLFDSMGKIDDWINTIDIEVKDKLLELIEDEVIFLHLGESALWNQEHDNAKTVINMSLLCSDFFMLACADSEQCEISDVLDIYDMYKDTEQHGKYGDCIWVARKRKWCPCDYILKRLISQSVNKDIISELESYKTD